MKICNCTLAGTRACENCSNNYSYIGPGIVETGKYEYKSKPVKYVETKTLVPKIIKEYDKKGNLIKETIEYVEK